MAISVGWRCFVASCRRQRNLLAHCYQREYKSLRLVTVMEEEIQVTDVYHYHVNVSQSVIYLDELSQVIYAWSWISSSMAWSKEQKFMQEFMVWSGQNCQIKSHHLE